ncbi:3-phosphoglycerate dehydrogenase [Candidatus Woesearchaeota archaeon]|nr:3-phosphoglycerate dehydrogenase [Candidatus Woesearchaeota archaeon]
MDNQVLIASGKPIDERVLQSAAAGFGEEGLESKVLIYSSREQLLEAVRHANYLLVRNDVVDREFLDAAEELKMVVRLGSGTDNINVDYATSRGIEVTNTPDANSASVAEMVIGLMVYFARNLANPQQNYIGFELAGKTLGIHGFGHVGKKLAKRALGMDMRVVASDINPDYETAIRYGVESVKPEELYRQCHIISVHVPLVRAPPNASTVGLVNYNLMSSIFRDGILINTARPEVVNHEDLIVRMMENPRFRYAVECHNADTEGFKERHGLRGFDGRLLVLPKMCSQTAEAHLGAFYEAIRIVSRHYASNGKSDPARFLGH